MAKIQAYKAYLKNRLQTRYESEEAEHIARSLLEHHLGQSYPQLIIHEVDPAPQEQAIARAVERLQAGEPLQYLIGEVQFYGLTLWVAPGVLIPRPETEELCHLIITDSRFAQAEHAVDIGTGSGCIALALARASARLQVEAIELSEAALAIAQKNIERTGLQSQVTICQADILSADFCPQRRDYAIVVSNPPYVLEHEATTMEEHVLAHEPAESLFVPDDDGTRFYRRVIELYHDRLAPDGVIAFEINPILANEICQLGEDKGLQCEVRQDMQGRNRFVFCRHNI